MQATGYDLNIEVNGITICYDDFGEGYIPILFIHGFPFDKSSWKPQMDFLKKTNRVIAYDIRGFGKSSLDSKELSMDLFADDLIKFMDALQIDKAIVCGLSMGGYILLNAITLSPKRFEAIILSDTQCIDDSPEEKEKRNKTIAQIKENGITDFTSDFIKRIFSEDSLNNEIESVTKIKNIILSTSTETIVGTLNALAQRSATCSLLGKITVPALIICGNEDALTPLNQSKFLLDKITNSILIGIDRAGHLANLEQPEEFNKHLNNFIAIQKKMVNEETLIAI